MTEHVFKALTRHDVANLLGQRPCVDDFKQANSVLPNWDTIAYTPTEMAEYGVKRSSIIWAWMRPQALTKAGMIEAACRMAECTVPIYANHHPDTTPLTNAIAAARKCIADPSDENIVAAGATGVVRFFF